MQKIFWATFLFMESNTGLYNLPFQLLYDGRKPSRITACIPDIRDADTSDTTVDAVYDFIMRWNIQRPVHTTCIETGTLSPTPQKLSHWRLLSPLLHPLRTCGYSRIYLPLCKGKYILFLDAFC